MNECRNCGVQAVSDLGFIGTIAPFFLKRVLQLECGFAPSAHPLKRLLRKLEPVRSFVEKVYGTSVLTEMQLCSACSFVQTKQPFADESIGRLYADYRSDSYNEERIRYEPEYASISSQVGNSNEEVRSRKTGLEQWLAGKLDVPSDFSMLDYGGADGRFLPDLPGVKYVFDISSIAPADGITRVESESKLGEYSYVQLAHVLEHVSFPLALTRKAAATLKGSGYLYIEVPQEINDETLGRLARKDRNVRLEIHEHINRYTVKSVTSLLRSADLSLVAVDSEDVDLGWTKATIVRALGRKN